MKIAVVFLLVAASSFSGLFDLLGAVSYNCANKVLKESGKLIADFIECSYQKGKRKLTDKQWEVAYKNVKKNMKKSGCNYSTVMEEVLAPQSHVVSEIIKAIRPLLISNMFTTECLSQILMGGLPYLLVDLDRNVCHKPDAELTNEDLRKIVKISSCALNGGAMKDLELVEDSKPIHYIMTKVMCVIAESFVPFISNEH
ncbi:uncharacterized protein RB166_009448 [Leptodactylus fuscus]